jgi:hypothetical protein
MNNQEKETHIMFRLTKEEKILLKKLADEHHLSMSSYIRFKTLFNK